MPPCLAATQRGWTCQPLRINTTWRARAGQRSLEVEVEACVKRAASANRHPLRYRRQRPEESLGRGKEADHFGRRPLLGLPCADDHLVLFFAEEAARARLRLRAHSQHRAETSCRRSRPLVVLVLAAPARRALGALGALGARARGVGEAAQGRLRPVKKVEHAAMGAPPLPTR